MNTKIKVAFFVVTIILVGIVIYLSIDLMSMKRKPDLQQLENKTINSTAINAVVQENVLENIANNISDNVLENNILTNETTNNEVNNEVKTNESEIIENTQNKEQIAIDIVKKDWGADDTVYFSNDGIDYNGQYIVAVREKSTTKVLSWYEVNVESKTFTVR